VQCDSLFTQTILCKVGKV